MCADDASVVIHGKDMLSIITTPNHEVYKLSTWLKDNTLYLNTDIVYHHPQSKNKTTRY